jgi:hypothetical protein
MPTKMVRPGGIRPPPVFQPGGVGNHTWYLRPRRLKMYIGGGVLLLIVIILLIIFLL